MLACTWTDAAVRLCEFQAKLRDATCFSCVPGGKDAA